eukprot:14835403-Alexandrium_andersonii.AAC.1
MCGSEHERQADVLRDDEVQEGYEATSIDGLEAEDVMHMNGRKSAGGELGTGCENEPEGVVRSLRNRI